MSDLQKLVIQLVIEEISTISEGFRGFNLNHMKSLETPKEMIAYATKHLPKLGSGSSRTVFGWKAGKVIKIMHNSTHGNQNQLEVEATTDSTLAPILARIFDYDDEDYTWVIAEGVKIILDNADLASKFTMSELMLGKMEQQGEAGASFWEGLEESLEFHNENYKSTFGHTVEKELSLENLNKFDVELLKKVHLGASNGLIDIDRYDHWGMTPDGRIVLADYGLNQSVI